MSVGIAVQAVWYANIAATVVLLLRLSSSGLLPVYRFLSFYLLSDIVQQAFTLKFQGHGRRLGEVYIAGQSVKMLLAVFVVMELYQLGLAAQPALARYGRRTVGFLLAACAVAAGVGLLASPAAPRGLARILFYFYSFERTMDSVVLIFLVLVSLFMLWFPVRAPRNVAIYVAGFALYFLFRWAGLLVAIVRPGSTDRLSLFLLSMSLMCLTAWIILLRSRAEDSVTVTGHRWNPAEMDRLRGQMEKINAVLEGLSRKFKRDPDYISLHSR